MTTPTLSDAATPTGNPLRFLPIAANLLPAEVLAGRRGRAVRRAVVSALVVFVVLLAAWYGVARLQTAVAGGDLRAAEQDAQAVQGQKAKFAQVTDVLSQSKTLQGQLAAVMAEDVTWSKLATDIQAARPAGVALSGLSGLLTSVAGNPGASAGAASPAGTAGAGTAGSTKLPSATSDKIVGTLNIAGYGPTKASVAAYLLALEKVDGVANVTFAGARSDEDGWHFTVRLDVTSKALGDRYRATPGGSGGQ
jgi:Tfp pilus assembly protein PilN